MNLNTTNDLLQSVERMIQVQPELGSLQNDWLISAADYAQKRMEWWATRRQEGCVPPELDVARSRAHDAFIANCVALARNMRKAGFDAEWYDDLHNDRRSIGDLACWIHLALTLAVR